MSSRLSQRVYVECHPLDIHRYIQLSHHITYIAKIRRDLQVSFHRRRPFSFLVSLTEYTTCTTAISCLASPLVSVSSQVAKNPFRLGGLVTMMYRNGVELVNVHIRPRGPECTKSIMWTWKRRNIILSLPLYLNVLTFACHHNAKHIITQTN